MRRHPPAVAHPAEPASASRNKRSLSPLRDHVAAHLPGPTYPQRDTIDAWPDSGQWPGQPCPSPLDGELLDEDPWHAGEVTWPDPLSLERPNEPSAPRTYSTAPHALTVDDSRTSAFPSNPRRRRSAILAFTIGTPLLALGLYALGARGVVALSGPPSDSAHHPAADDNAARALAMSPEDRSYDLAGHAIDSLTSTVSSTCRTPGMQPASLWVTTTFSPHGNVESVIVEGAPPTATDLPRCVERLVRTLTIPPYRGDPIRIERGIVLP